MNFAILLKEACPTSEYMPWKPWKFYLNFLSQILSCYCFQSPSCTVNKTLEFGLLVRIKNCPTWGQFIFNYFSPPTACLFSQEFLIVFFI